VFGFFLYPKKEGGADTWSFVCPEPDSPCEEKGRASQWWFGCLGKRRRGNLASLEFVCRKGGKERGGQIVQRPYPLPGAEPLASGGEKKEKCCSGKKKAKWAQVLFIDQRKGVTRHRALAEGRGAAFARQGRKKTFGPELFQRRVRVLLYPKRKGKNRGRPAVRMPRIKESSWA